MKRFNAKSHRLAMLRTSGDWLIVEDVERRLAFGHVTRDLLGFGDILLYRPNERLGAACVGPGFIRGYDIPPYWMLEQVTVASHGAEHIRAAQENKELRRKWLSQGFGARLVIYPDREDREGGDMDPTIADVK